VDFDTWDGRATCFFTSPAELDLLALDGAADDAGYETVGMTLQVSGRTVSASCAECGEDVTWLEVPETGQRFELIGDAAAGQTLRLHGTVSDWHTEHVRVMHE
jgi:hypothetical protein